MFGGDSSFDAQNDPIVRIAAGHLRRALERYYLTAGSADPLVISVPKGGYVPTFSHRTLVDSTSVTPVTASVTDVYEVPKAELGRYRVSAIAVTVIALLALAVFFGSRGLTTESGAGKEPTRLLVEPFDDLGGTMTSSDISIGLTQEIIGQLSRFRDITVVEVDQGSGSPPDLSPRYSLLGSVWLTLETFRLRVRLINCSDGAVLWAESYDGAVTVSKVLQEQKYIAENVATTLAQVNGVILQADTQIMLSGPPDDWAAYACTLSFYAYRATMNLDAAGRSLECLEGAVTESPDYATAWALLALAELDRLRLQFPHDPDFFEQEIDRILLHSRCAASLDPQNVRAMEAEMFCSPFSSAAGLPKGAVSESARLHKTRMTQSFWANTGTGWPCPAAGNKGLP